MIETWTESMNGHFDKLHIPGLGVIHRFSNVDGPDAEFHDHPWEFTSLILKGGYIEEIYDPETGQVQVFERRTRDFIGPHNPIHRVTHLLDCSMCWTLADYGQFRGHEAEFFRLENGLLTKVR